MGRPAAEAPQFGQRLRGLREAAGLTQAALAERAGLSVKAIAALENGRRLRPHPSTVHALGEALGLAEEGRAALAATVAASGGPPLGSAHLWDGDESTKQS